MFLPVEGTLATSAQSPFTVHMGFRGPDGGTANEGRAQVSDSLLRAKTGLYSRLAGGAGSLETSQQAEFTHLPVEAAQASKDRNCGSSTILLKKKS